MNLDVKALIDGKIDKNYDDKVFWYASKVLFENEIISIYLENKNIVSLDNCDFESIKVSQIAKIKQEDEKEMNDVLISTGSFIFINDKLLVTKRQLDTQFDAGFWTTPAGRCDRTIYECTIKETIEEIDIYKDENKIVPDISKGFIKDTKNIDFYKTSNFNKDINIKMNKIRFYFENEFVEEFDSWSYYVKKVNTLELRLPIFTILDEEKLTFKNNEFNMPVDLKTIEDLSKMEIVPALEKLLSEIKN